MSRQEGIRNLGRRALGQGPCESLKGDGKEFGRGGFGLLDEYLAQIREIPLLSHDREVELAQTIERGKEALVEIEQLGSGVDGRRGELEELVAAGQEAREKLAAANTRLVVAVAKNPKYQGKGLLFLDLIQEGSVGLMRAVDKYDWRRGLRFSTLAVPWIRQEITRALSSQSRFVRLPERLVNELRVLSRVRKELAQELRRRPELNELAQRMEELEGWGEKKVRRLLEADQRVLSLEELERGGENWGKFIDDQRVLTPEQGCGRRDLHLLLEEWMFDKLTWHEAIILRLLFGLKDGEERTLTEVGERLGLSRWKIGQLWRGVRDRVRQPPNAEWRRLRSALHEYWLDW